MKHSTLLRLILVCLFTVCLCALLCMTASAKDVVGGDYDINVAGVTVTSGNCEDITGDGTVSFDPATKTLRIRNFRNEQTVALANGLEFSDGTPVRAIFSVICTSDEDINVVIEGNCHFAGGVRIDNGTVTLQNATVTFGERASCYFDTRDGNLFIQNSTVNLSDCSYLTAVTHGREAVTGILARNLQMVDSTLTFKGGDKSAYVYYDAVTRYYDALICALARCEIKDSTVEIEMPFPLFHTTLLADREDLLLSGVDVTMKNQAVCFSAPNGILGFHDCRIEVEDSFDLALARNFQCNTSTLRATTFYTGITLEGTNFYDSKEVSFVAGSRMELEALDLERMIEEIWEVCWDTIDPAQRQEYANYDAFLADVTAFYERTSSGSYGLYLNTALLTFKESRVDIVGYALGILGRGDTVLQMSEDLRLRIKAAHAAIVLFSKQEHAIRSSVTFHSRGSEITSEQMTEDASDLGTSVFTFSKRGITATADSFDSAAAVALGIEGASATLVIRTKGSIDGIVWVLVAVAATVVILILLYAVIMLAPTETKKAYGSAGIEQAPEAAKEKASDDQPDQPQEE